MLPNVTIAQTAVLSSLDYPSGRDTIVMTELDFPSVRYVYDQLATRLGARIVVVPSNDGIRIDTERLLDAIDERTRLVAISHVLFRSAYIMDVAAICRRAHDVGALVSLDAFHSVGVIPVDVKALGADFLSGGVLKWLCGGPGGAFLYVAPEVGRDAASVVYRLAGARDGHSASSPTCTTPTTHGVGSMARRRFQRSSRRSRDRASCGAPASSKIREKSVRQTTRLIALADERGYKVTAPRDSARRGGTVAFDVPHSYGVAQALSR